MLPIPRSIPCPENNKKDMEVSSAPISKKVETVNDGDNDMVSSEKGEVNSLSGITCPSTPERKKKETEKEDGPSFLTPPRSSSISRILKNDGFAAANNKDQLSSSPPTEEKHENDPCCTTTNNEQERFRALLQKEANYTIPAISHKRQNYLSWEDYFMSIAFLSAQRSKDPHSQSGACIVNSDKRIVGIGYNGFPRNCPDQHMPWANTGESVLHTKYPYMFPAEMNAILNKCSADVVGATMYVALFPGNECAKLIIQAGIREVIYLNNTNHETEESRCSRILFGLSGVKLTQHHPKQHKIVVDFGPNTLSENENEQVLQEKTQHSAKPSSEEEHNKIKTLLQKEANYDIDHPSNTSMRQDYLSWDNYFLAVAFLSAQRSKDPNTQVGACIVNADRRIVGIGYNGFPRGCSDDCLPWSRKGETTLHTKYPYVCHAEMNAIMNKCTADLVGATIYVALFPCNDCAKLIIQSGIRRVVYLNDQYHDTDACRASRILFGMAGVELRQHRPHLRRIVLDLTCPSSSRMI